MESVLLILHIFVCVALVGSILLQQNSSDGLSGIGGGSNNSFMSGRSSANFLTKTTSILATIFILNSLVLAVIASHKGKEASLIDKIVPIQGLEQQQNNSGSNSAPSELPEPAKPSVPLAK